MSTLAEQELLDVSIDRLVFQSVDRAGLSTGVGDALEDGTLEETMQGASGLTLTIRDRDQASLNSGLFGSRVLCNLDGCDFRLTRVSPDTEGETLDALLEHALVAEMREHDSPLKASRGSTTRAEFILMMLRELRRPYNFICPALHRRQPQEATPVELASETAALEGSLHSTDRAPSVGTAGLTVKGAAMSTHQSIEASYLLRGCEHEGASQQVMVACICAGIQESSLGDDPSTFTPNSAGYYGVLQFGSGTKGSAPSGIDPHDTETAARYFCKGGKGFQGGGAINVAAGLPPISARAKSPGEVAWIVEAPGGSPQPYVQWEGEAKAIVEAFLGAKLGSFTGTSSSGSATDEVKTATYEFTRGKGEEREDTFTCATRLANEVGWRFFVCGPRNIYFVSDEDLIRAAARYVVTAQTPGFVRLGGDIELGGRTVVIKGRRQPKPSELGLTARVGRWAAPPGCVIELDGFGPGDGKWLVDSVKRPIFDAEATIQLRAPQKPKPEPADEWKEGPPPSGDVSAVLKSHPELKRGVAEVVAAILAKYPSLTITSTFRPGGTSYHALGRACDLAGEDMDSIASWVGKTFGPKLVEGIHSPTLSIKDGKEVPASFWGAATWSEHRNHIHVAV